MRRGRKVQAVFISPVKKRVLFWKLLGIIFLIVLISRIKWEDTIYILHNSNLKYFLLACLLEPMRFFIDTIRWKLILHFQRINYSFKDAFVVNLASCYLGHVTPARIGNFIRGFYLSCDRRIPLGLSFSSVIWEKYLELVFTLFIGLWGTIIYISGFNLVYIICMGLFIVICLFYFLYSFDIQKKLFKSITIRIPKLRGLSIENFHNGLKLINFKVLLVCIIITICSFLIFAFQGYLITMAVNINIKFLDFAVIFYMSKMISRLVPVSFSGWGSKDVFLILIFKNIGIDEKLALAFTILFLFSSYFVSLLLGFIAWERKALIWQKT